MNASFKKRIIAYLIDFTFITLLVTIIINLIPRSSSVVSLNHKMNDLTDKVLNSDMSFNSYIKEYSICLKEYDTNNLIANIINFVITFVYFIVIPIFFNKTWGKKIMNISIKRKDGKKLTFFNMFVRGIIDVGIIYSVATLFLGGILNPMSYLLSIFILGIIQIILVIISIIMILYRSDKCGLQDILSRSNVVIDEVK